MTRTGKSRSRRPLSKRPPMWCKYSPEEVEAFVIKLAKEEKTPSKIGVILRDQYGIPLVKSIVGKSIKQIILDEGIEIPVPEDLNNLLQKASTLSRHLNRNRSDVLNRRSLQLIAARIRRLAKYYRRNNRLPQDWKYIPQIEYV
ncbi:30S ribosomal protein S15 [Candidatus Bathyarchaeota archaeon]|nr:30S ribosomal protein S15 [Candidatus Bathyarchaeota archaeon]